MAQRLDGRIAVITGASKGLGKEIALALAGAGAAVALAARSTELLEGVRAEIEARGGKAAAFVADVSKESEVERLGGEIREKLGLPDILINNAGINIRKPLAEYSYKEWRQVLDINLDGAFLCSHAFVGGMMEKRFGRIINMTSIMSHVAFPGRTAYCASKFGLLGMTKALALELAPYGITVNGLSPGPFATEMNTILINDPVRNQEFTSRIPMGHWGKVEDIGKLALYLCSEEASFITGTDVLIDGGWTAQ